jgi:hypothetical protein
MSIGKTDSTWWKSVGDWLNKDTRHQLIIFTHQPSRDGRLAAHINAAEKDMQNLFLQYTALSAVERDRVRGQITVILNSELFGKNLFQLKRNTASQQA